MTIRGGPCDLQALFNSPMPSLLSLNLDPLNVLELASKWANPYGISRRIVGADFH